MVWSGCSRVAQRVVSVRWLAMPSTVAVRAAQQLLAWCTRRHPGAGTRAGSPGRLPAQPATRMPLPPACASLSHEEDASASKTAENPGWAAPQSGGGAVTQTKIVQAATTRAATALGIKQHPTGCAAPLPCSLAIAASTRSPPGCSPAARRCTPSLRGLLWKDASGRWPRSRLASRATRSQTMRRIPLLTPAAWYVPAPRAAGGSSSKTKSVDGERAAPSPVGQTGIPLCARGHLGILLLPSRTPVPRVRVCAWRATLTLFRRPAAVAGASRGRSCCSRWHC